MDRCLSLRARKVLGLTLGVLEMLCFGGIIFGFNALIPVLKHEHIFSYLCEDPGINTGCDEQNQMFSYAFTTFMVTQMLMLIVVGLLIDNLGLRIVKLIAAATCGFGMILFALITSENSLMIFPAGCLVSVGGMALLICNLSISKLFGRTSVLALSTISGSHDAASSVFAIMALGVDNGIPHRIMFIALGCSGFLLSVFSALFVTTHRIGHMSNEPHPPENEKVDREAVSLIYQRHTNLKVLPDL